jgi:exodeoxyribonuclease VII large subunit
MQLNFDLRGAPPANKPPLKHEEPVVLTVTALTRKVRSLLEDRIGNLHVEGEISNLRKQNSGHIYFTLKDAGAQIACALFAGQTAQLKGMDFCDGVHVRLSGQLTVYETRGIYQIIVHRVEPCGVGALQARFEDLKKRLYAEGLFSLDRKRPLPRFPRRIGVITSPTGAAIRDFLNVLHRRQRGIEVLIYPARVQGRGAANEIKEGIRFFSEDAPKLGWNIDILVLTRGGGSLEDLWEFNEESLARAVSASPIPLVSAVGHEIDFTICDLVADLRAPTPSAAAEILSTDSSEVLDRLSQFKSRLGNPVTSRLQSLRAFLESLRRTALFLEPHRVLRENLLTLDHMSDDLAATTEARLRDLTLKLSRHSRAIEVCNPDRILTGIRHSLETSSSKIQHLANACIVQHLSHLKNLCGLLKALNPTASLERGYTITLGADGKILRSAKEATQETRLTTRFHDGEIHSEIATCTHSPKPSDLS